MGIGVILDEGEIGGMCQISKEGGNCQVAEEEQNLRGRLSFC